MVLAGVKHGTRLSRWWTHTKIIVDPARRSSGLEKRLCFSPQFYYGYQNNSFGTILGFPFYFAVDKRNTKPACSHQRGDVGFVCVKQSYYSTNRRNFRSNTKKQERSELPKTRPVRKRSVEQEHEEQQQQQQQQPQQQQRQPSAWEQIKSIPNIITVSRILSTPVISYFIVTERHEYAIAGCLGAGFTDWLDGYLAKNYNMSTVLGTYLDPLADKIFINMLAVSLAYQQVLPLGIVSVWFTKDILLMVGTYQLVKSQTKEGYCVVDPARTPLKVEPTFISKLNTALQIITITTGMMLPLYCGGGGENVYLLGAIQPNALMDSLCWITAGTTLTSMASYLDGSHLTSSGNELRDQLRKTTERLRRNVRQKVVARRRRRVPKQ